ncbi:hypothetical protein FRC10_000139 [Ceratobasidium sp. 414]|nr:hypothetical protein FRC10_000139 [Ceratobasidium sp. 414]
MPKAKVDSTETEGPSLFKRGQDKVTQMWVDWGKAQGGWKVITKLRGASYLGSLKVHTYGEKLIDRIDFEELALASTDASLGPKASQQSTRDSEGKRLSEQQSKMHSVSNAIKPIASKELDRIYAGTSPAPPPGKPATPTASNDPSADPTVTLLLPDPSMAIPRILNAYALPKEAERSFLRAIEQARIRSEADGDMEDD